MIAAVLKMILGLLAVIGSFGFIIFIHELGHFITARSVGIRCPYFAIGFGPRLSSFMWRGTEFSVRLFPFGGYVLMTGEEPEGQDVETWSEQVARILRGVSLPATKEEILAHLDSRSEGEKEPGFDEVHEHLRWVEDKTYDKLVELEGNYNNRTIPQRMLVISGGVIMNFISTILILWFVGAVYGLGDIWQNNSPRVSGVVPGSPAAVAGLEQGDRIVSVAGVELLSSLELIEVVGARPAQPVELVYRRWEEPLKTVTLTPDLAIGNVTFAVDKQGVKVSGAPEKLQPSFPEGARVEGFEDAQALADAAREQLEGKKEEAEAQVALTVGGKEVAISGKAGALKPVGRIGVELGYVTSLHIEPRATSEVTAVEPGGFAAQLGLKPGDRLFQFNGFMVVSGASLADQAANTLMQREGPKKLTLEVLRDGKFETLEAESIPGDLTNWGMTLQPVDAATIAKAPFRWIGHFVAMPVILFSRWMQSLIPTKVIREGVQGPLGIMQVLYQLSDNGIAEFLFFVAILNAAVGGFNLIPFPALDGARLLLLIIAGIRRREIDPDKEARLHYAGLLILLTMVLFVSVMDVQRLLAGKILIE